MTGNPSSTLERDLDDIKLQVKRELASIRDLMDSVGYRTRTPTWKAPYHIHRLRRSLRLHYLALRIRAANNPSSNMMELYWDLPE
ncbi:hypothetical protein EU546_03760 [Candidatus Thorarchaeota archaeon]|nr:MAG: hypothetical protein EU546_03760 [Candidatus Thorarchaeota archaeon]